MGTAITPFQFNDRPIRAITKEDGTIWFVAKDVCDVLSIVNVSDALTALDLDEKADLGISDASNDSKQLRKHKIVSEPGLYKLVFRSNKPDAKAFTKWVTSEVLPSIRKTGSYKAPWAGGPTRVPEIQEVPDIAKAFCASPAWSPQLRSGTSLRPTSASLMASAVGR